jgi:hypothetical protein
MAGRALFDHFSRRNKNIPPLRKPTITPHSRASDFNREAVNNCFDILEAEYEKVSYPADRVYNIDETELSIVKTKIPQMVRLKGTRQLD